MPPFQDVDQTNAIDTTQTNNFVQQPKKTNLNPFVETYFEPLQTEPKAGDVISFVYNKKLYYEIHDRSPMVLILDWSRGNRIRGINLHYITYNVMGTVIEMAHKGLLYSYSQVRSMQMCVNAFRHYIWAWIIQGSIRKMNLEAIQAEVNTVKTYGKMSEDDMRKVVQEQLQKKTQQTQARNYGTIPSQPASMPGTGTIPGQPASIPAMSNLNTSNPLGNQ